MVEDINSINPDNIEVVEHPIFKESNAEQLVFERPEPKVPNVEWYGALMSKQTSKVANVVNEVLTREEEQTLFLRLNLSRLRIKDLKKVYITKDGTFTTEEGKAEYVKWIKRYKDAENTLAKANLPLVLELIRSKFYNSGVDYAEMVSEGNMALIRSIRHFDVSTGNKFSTYATWAVYRSLLRALREYTDSHNLSPVSFEEDADKGKEVEEKMESDELKHIRSLVYDAKNEANLTPIELEVIKLRFGFVAEETRSEIGRKFGVSGEWIRHHENNALAKLRIVLQNEENVV